VQQTRINDVQGEGRSGKEKWKGDVKGEGEGRNGKEKWKGDGEGGRGK
jgi:hypothetical protein